MKKIINLIVRMYNNNVLRYIFWGGCTTLVNLFCFTVFRHFGLGLNIANFFSIVIAIVFAYIVNSFFVFRYKVNGFSGHIKPFLTFVSARITTMIIEIGGVWLLVEKIGLRDLLGKFIIQFVILVLNYIFSKFLVFRKKK